MNIPEWVNTKTGCYGGGLYGDGLSDGNCIRFDKLIGSDCGYGNGSGCGWVFWGGGDGYGELNEKDIV